jgi:hypothetical protein
MYDDAGDYIDDGAGGFVETDTAAPAIRHQLLDVLGEWIGDPDAGRDRRGVAGRANTIREAEIEADTLRVALDVLVLEGLIEDVEITTDRDATGRFAFLITSRDTKSGETITFDNLQSFGV